MGDWRPERVAQFLVTAVGLEQAMEFAGWRYEKLAMRRPQRRALEIGGVAAAAWIMSNRPTLHAVGQGMGADFMYKATEATFWLGVISIIGRMMSSPQEKRLSRLRGG